MFRKLLLMLFMVIGLLSCSDRNFNNPVDPLNIDENLAAPSQFTINVADENVLELNWRDNCDIEDGFSIERSTDAINFTKVAELAANVNAWQDTHVSLGNTYSYRIRITHESYASQAVSSTISYRLLAPADIAIEQLTDTQFKLSWNDTNHFEEGYKIDLKVGAAAWQLDYASVPANNSSWINTTDLADTVIVAWRARAFYKSLHSAYTSEVYLTVAEPIISVPSGQYNEDFNVSITCATPGAQIRYTTNGNDPAETSSPFTGLIPIERNLTLQAKAYKSGWIASGIATASYTMKVADPIISVPSGEYSEAINVTLTCATPGAEIRYTTNGSDPTLSSTFYSSPVYIANTTLLKAKAFKDYWMASTTVTYSYYFEASYVQGGSFINGTSNVTLSSYVIDNYEVTQSSYQAVMGTEPSSFVGNPNRPVEQVSWFNAIEYCNRLSIQKGLVPCYSYGTNGTNPSNWPAGWNTGYLNHSNVSCNWSANGYRLPTEMEWMYAARGGNLSHGYTYSGSNTVVNVAWYNQNSGNRTHDVGALVANELGIFDMSGNVWEWVWDIYGDYPSGSQSNPTGATSGDYRGWRGGGWFNVESYCNVLQRNSSYSTTTNSGVGFRCARTIP